MASVRLTYTGSSTSWRAALRAGSRTLVDCGHIHRNRDSGQGNARHCGAELVRAARDPETAGRFIAATVYAAQRARALGARRTDEDARAAAEATVAAWRDAVTAAGFHMEPSWAQRSVGATCGCCPIPR